MNARAWSSSLGMALLSAVLTLLAGCDDAGAPGAASSAEAQPAGPIEVLSRLVGERDAEPRKVQVFDYGFGEPMAAATIEVPGNWKTRGGIQWNRQVECISNSMRVEWSAVSPDGLRAVELMPGFAWQVKGFEVGMNPCPVASMRSVRAYLDALVRELYPGVTVIEYRDRADLLAGSKAPPAAPGVKARQEAGEIVLGYSSDGREMRESIAAVATFTEVTIQGMRPSLMGGVPNAYVVRAPASQWDAALGERIRQSMTADKDWIARISAYAKETADAKGAAQRAQIDRWHNARMAEISARGARDRAAIRAQTIREIGEINTAGWKARQQSIDRMHRDRVDTIREVNRYHDPAANREVTLSSHYNHGWRTDDGRYIATDDPNFDPSRDLGVQGKEMQRVR